MIKINDENNFPQCNSCGSESGTIDIKFYFRDNTNSSSSICLCKDCRNELLEKIKEYDNPNVIHVKNLEMFVIKEDS